MKVLLPHQFDSLLAVVWPSTPGQEPIFVELDLINTDT